MKGKIKHHQPQFFFLPCEEYHITINEYQENYADMVIVKKIIVATCLFRTTELQPSYEILTRITKHYQTNSKDD